MKKVKKPTPTKKAIASPAAAKRGGKGGGGGGDGVVARAAAKLVPANVSCGRDGIRVFLFLSSFYGPRRRFGLFVAVFVVVIRLLYCQLTVAVSDLPNPSCLAVYFFYSLSLCFGRGLTMRFARNVSKHRLLQLRFRSGMYVEVLVLSPFSPITCRSLVEQEAAQSLSGSHASF